METDWGGEWLGRVGRVHFQVEEEDPQMQGRRSQITIHSSVQTLKSPRGAPPQSGGFKVKVWNMRRLAQVGSRRSTPTQTKPAFRFSRLAFALQLVSLQGLNMSTASTRRCPPPPPSEPQLHTDTHRHTTHTHTLLSPAQKRPAGLH